MKKLFFSSLLLMGMALLSLGCRGNKSEQTATTEHIDNVQISQAQDFTFDVNTTQQTYTSIKLSPVSNNTQEARVRFLTPANAQYSLEVTPYVFCHDSRFRNFPVETVVNFSNLNNQSSTGKYSKYGQNNRKMTKQYLRQGEQVLITISVTNPSNLICDNITVMVYAGVLRFY